MFICVCNGVTERQIREAVAQGAGSLAELNVYLGVASGCGTCADFACQVMHETLQATASGNNLQAA